jgi:FtsZ-binding cell division protein ZapB
MSIKINKNDCTGEILLSSGHSVVMGHKPQKIAVQALSDHLESDNNNTAVERFGLWDVSTPNYATYYPDVTADDLNPKEIEFIQPVFRMLSEVILNKGWRPIDFSKKGVLKKSMNMLLGQTINIDHEIAVGNAIGAVSEVYWQNGYKTKSGIEVPAGINAVLKIDGKSNPRIARGVMMEPPSIHSNSVTVRFKFEPSHVLDDQDSFWNLLGTFDSNGEMYRLVVIEILGYSETSLVSHGADPFAQKVKEDGEIVNPEYANNQSMSFSADGELDIKDGHIQYDFKNELKLSADEPSTPRQNNNNNNNNSNMTELEKLISDISAKFSFTKEDGITKENILEKIGEKLTAQTTEIETLTKEKNTLVTEKATLTTERDNLKTENAAFTANAETFTQLTESTRAEAERLYSLCKGDKKDQTIIDMIKTSDLRTSASFVKQYQAEADEKFPEKCTDCGSTNLSRTSAKASKDGVVTDKETGGENGNKQPKSTAEVRNNLKNKKRNPSIVLSNSKSGESK